MTIIYIYIYIYCYCFSSFITVWYFIHFDFCVVFLPILYCLLIYSTSSLVLCFKCDQNIFILIVL